MSDYNEERRESTNPIGLKRTSKQQKKCGSLGIGEYRAFGAQDPTARVHDVLVGGVDAEHLVHERGLGEDEERTALGESTTRMVKTLGVKMVPSTTHGQSFYWSVS